MRTIFFSAAVMMLAASAAFAAEVPASKPASKTDFETLKKSAEKGDAQAQFDLGQCYFNGQGADRDLIQAFEWFAKSAGQGHVKAQYALALCYDKGYGTPKNTQKAFEWAQKAAKSGHANAQHYLAEYYENLAVNSRQDTAENRTMLNEWHKKAFVQYQKAAEQGEADAQFNLGLCLDFCLQGREKLTTQHAKAREWFTKAAEHYQTLADRGDAEAQYILYRLFAGGLGVKADMKKAVEWLKTSAEQEHVEAQITLAEHHATGYPHIAQNDEETAKWFTQAAEQGHVEARHALGLYYYRKKDDEKAVEWLTKAAESGHLEAQCVLAIHNATRNGDDMDAGTRDILDWYRGHIPYDFDWTHPTAEHGNRMAQYNLGRCYEEGVGVDKDLDQAMMWYRKAANQRLQKAVDKVKQFQKKK